MTLMDIFAFRDLEKQSEGGFGDILDRTDATMGYLTPRTKRLLTDYRDSMLSGGVKQVRLQVRVTELEYSSISRKDGSERITGHARCVTDDEYLKMIAAKKREQDSALADKAERGRIREENRRRGGNAVSRGQSRVNNRSSNSSSLAEQPSIDSHLCVVPSRTARPRPLSTIEDNEDEDTSIMEEDSPEATILSPGSPMPSHPTRTPPQTPRRPRNKRVHFVSEETSATNHSATSELTDFSAQNILEGRRQRRTTRV